jgi:hypothetical protein
LTSCHFLILSRLLTSPVWAQLTLTVPTWGTRSLYLQNGAPFHRVCAHSLTGVENSSDRKMSSSFKIAAEPPASAPYWSKSYAEFVMEKELEEAKAVVEECFHRRAKRAGLEGTLSAGRHMTERELEMLGEALGDRTGSRAKRRKEIEEMTIEDMEAEIGETNAVIRKRRREGTGLLPMPLALLMYLMVSLVEGFTAYDCSNRSNVVEAYSLLEPDTCANMGKEGEVETTVYGEIVQIKQDRMILVFQCIVVETLVAQYCGMFLAAGVTRYIRSGAQASRGLGVPASEAERPDHHQREDGEGQDWSDCIPQHVPVQQSGR